MGFHKRRITKDLILSQKNFNDIKRLLNADALIYDVWSSNFFKFLDENYEVYQEKRNNYLEKSKFLSSMPDTSGFDNKYLSNILLNLKSNPSWLDISLCLERFDPNITEDIAGRFEDLCNLYISLIEKEFDKSGL